ncbi:MAG: hypothetical protein WCE61_22580 [Candidatus Acidiferrum sp.]
MPRRSLAQRQVLGTWAKPLRPDFQLFSVSAFSFSYPSMLRARSSSSKNNSNLGFEAKLWLAADKLHSNMEVVGHDT